MSAEEFESTLTEADRATGEPAMIVDVEGFEGPLDLLLMLARQQKVDLAKISILALADQYLSFIEAARQLRLELAADYLVMAAWLAYLKSRLLLPEAAPGEGPSAEEMALALAQRLRRLEAFREVASKLMGRPQLDRDVFARGARFRQRPHGALLEAHARKRAARALHRVGRQQIVERGGPFRLFNFGDRLGRAAREDVAVELRPLHQLAGEFADRLQPAQAIG